MSYTIFSAVSSSLILSGGATSLKICPFQIKLGVGRLGISRFGGGGGRRQCQQLGWMIAVDVLPKPLH